MAPSKDPASLEAIRAQLRQHMDDLVKPCAEPPDRDWNALGREHQALMRRLRRTYHSRLGWWWIRAKETLAQAYGAVAFWRWQVLPPRLKPCSASSTIMLGVAERVRAARPGTDRIELTADSMASWLTDEAIQQAGCDAPGCLRILRQSLNREFAVLVGGAGRLWFEAAGPDRVVVHISR
jgi:hypothetical protein